MSLSMGNSCPEMDLPLSEARNTRGSVSGVHQTLERLGRHGFRPDFLHALAADLGPSFEYLLDARPDHRAWQNGIHPNVELAELDSQRFGEAN